MPDRAAPATRWANRLLIVSAVLVVWSVLIAVTGGFRVEFGPVRISSRNAARVFLFALLPAALAWRLAYTEWLESYLRRSRPALQRAALPIAALLATALFVTGLLYGVRAAAAADPSGYVSQSGLWVHGTLRIDQRYADALPWPEAKHTLPPLGYRVGVGDAMVPTYAPGLPLLMAAGRLISSCGPFLVAPLCGALLVIFTFVLGRPLFGAAVSLAAAALVACSPAVVYLSLMPMADVPAAAFWSGSLAMGLRRTRGGALLSGVLAGIAILIRPNLVPLAVFPWLLMMVRCGSWRAALPLTGLFAIGTFPAALIVAVLNSFLYGSPLTSGYGDLSADFARRHAWTNVLHYTSWWWQSQGPLGFVFVAALFRPAIARRREINVALGFAATLCLIYLFYLPFDTWWFLRFLLPAVPIVFLLCADTVARASLGSASVQAVALSAFVMAAAGYAFRFADLNDLTGIGRGEHRYAEAAAYIAKATGPEAVVLSFHHSGSVRYYAGRLSLRWDVLGPSALDTAVAALNERGVATYLLLEDFEEPQFRDRFAAQQTVKELDYGPSALGRNGQMRLYPLKAPGAGAPRSPVVMPPLPDRSCIDMSPDYAEPGAARRLRARQ